jgi:hypothetical protein
MCASDTPSGDVTVTRTYQTNRWALAVAAFSLSAAVSVAPAKASTLSYDVSFSIQGIYDSAQYYGDGTATGSFDITYDPSLAGVGGYPNQSLSGVISSLTYTISVPELGGNLSLNPITTFTFNYGTLTLYSNYTEDQNKDFTDVPDLVIGINGLPVTPPSGESAAGDVWFSVTADGYTETGSGTASFAATTTPLPAALPLFATGLGALGLFGWRRKRKNTTGAIAAV